MRDTDRVTGASVNVPSTAGDNVLGSDRNRLGLPNVPRYKLVARDGCGVPIRVGYVKSFMWDADAIGDCVAGLGFNPRAEVYILAAGVPIRAIEEPRRPLGNLSREA
jgi:hypothetical protein